MPTQSLKSKLGEVKYRAKITKQHLGEKVSFPNEPREKEFAQILKSRLDMYQKTFKNLELRKLIKSPFLEIGAEYALASTLLVNELKARGFALDISLHSLAKASHFAKIFHFSKIPKLICADANNLPFKSNSLPFIFVYESLHHFPNPSPVLAEIYRVLAPGGVCLIGSDPIKQTFQIKLWRRPTKLRLWEKLLKATLILPFISHIGKTEVEHQIIEEAFPLSVWENSLSIFDHVEVTVQSRLGLSESRVKSATGDWLQPMAATRLAINILGGGLQAICFKKGHLPEAPSKLETLLICPNCQSSKNRQNPLVKVGQTLICRICNSTYNKHSGVLTILRKDLEKAILDISS